MYLRKVIAILVSISLLLSSTSLVLAKDTSDQQLIADKLNKLGILTGDGNGNFNLEGSLKRSEAVTFITKLMGKYTYVQENQATLKKTVFKDIKETDWFAPYVGFCYKNGIIAGYNGKFGANDILTEQAFLVMLLKLLKYTGSDDIKWNDNVFKKAYDVGLVTDKTYLTKTKDGNNSYSRGQATLIINTSLGVKLKGESTTLLQSLINDGAIKREDAISLGLITDTVAPQPTYTVTSPSGGTSTSPETVVLAVSSVTALNCKQLEVKFSQTMDKASAENESYYSIRDMGINLIALTSGAIELTDSKTAVITLNNSVDSKLINSSTAKVTVRKGIKTVSGEELAANKEFEVPVQDAIIPSVIKAESTGEYKIKLTFSESVYGGANTDTLDNSNFVVKSGTYTYPVQTTKLSGNTITLSLGTKLIGGPVVITVNANGDQAVGAIRDYAGYKVFMNDTTFTYANDTSVAVVTVKEATQNTIKLGFSKPVKGTNIKLYHSVNGAVANLAVASTIEIYSDTLTFTYSDQTPVPVGIVKLFLVNSTVSGEEMVDSYGIKVPDQELSATVVADVTALYVYSTELITNICYKMTFNKEVDKQTAESLDNYTFKSVADNKPVSFIPSLDSTYKTVRFNIPAHLKDNTQYQVVIKKAKDLAGNTTIANKVFTFTTGDNTAPSIKNTECCTNNSEGKILIVFSEPMNEAQMLDKSNYMVKANSSSSLKALGEVDKVTKLSENLIIIDLEEAVDKPTVKVTSITDLAGKSLYNSFEPVTLTGIEAETVNITSAELIAKNKVKVTFNRNMSVFYPSDIKFIGVTAGAINAQYVESMEYNIDGHTALVLVLNKELTTDVKYNESIISTITVATPSSLSICRTSLGGAQTIAIGDKVAPKILTYDHDADPTTDQVANVTVSGNVIASMINGTVVKDTTGIITISFSEAIDSHALSILSFRVNGYTVNSISNATANQVVLTIKADADNTPARTSVTQVYNITDNASNIFASGTTWTVR